MILARRLYPHVWIVVLLLSLAALVWVNLIRAREVDRISQRGLTPPRVDAASPTGYAGGVRVLLAPGHNNESYQWIVQTQLSIAQRTWRLRHVDYDNAPNGRPVYSASVYRWWLGAVAWMDHKLSGRPIGLAVERAALWADPGLLILFVAAGTLFVRWRFGAFAAVVFAVLGPTLYPFGGAFLPGCPDDIGLGLVLSAACGLLMLAGLVAHGGKAPSPRPWFVASALVGCLALWVNVPTTVWLLLGLGLGGLLGEWLCGRDVPNPLPWRTWGWTGAVGTVLAWFAEYAPQHLEFGAKRLTDVHPLYALAWLGGGEVLAQCARWVRGTKPTAHWTGKLPLGLGLAALASVPAAMIVADAPGFLVKDAFALRLTALGAPAEFPSFVTWIVRTWEPLPLLAVTLPLLLLIAVLVLIVRLEPPARLALTIMGMPVICALVLAFLQIGWWAQVDALLLVSGVSSCAVMAGARPGAKLWLGCGAAAIGLPGALLIIPRLPVAENQPPDPQTVVAMAERHFAHWLALRSGPDGATVLAPPNLTVSVLFHGGLRGLGSPYRENQEGFLGAVRIAGATLAYEAQALVGQRRLSHIAIPSWDGFLNQYARLGANQPENTLMGLLHRWLPPRWLRPAPYYLPDFGSGTANGVVLFEVVEVQDQASSLSRLTEYFVDMGMLEPATQAARVLGSDFSSDIGAQVAKARTEIVRRDAVGFAKSVAAISAGLRDGADEALDWDRRVSLFLVLAEAGREEEARTQAQRCLDEMGEFEVRHLPEARLFRFLVQCKAYGLEITDPELRQLAAALLPEQLRTQI